jgi:hypothetical protein
MPRKKKGKPSAGPKAARLRAATLNLRHEAAVLAAIKSLAPTQGQHPPTNFYLTLALTIEHRFFHER